MCGRHVIVEKTTPTYKRSEAAELSEFFSDVNNDHLTHILLYVYVHTIRTHAMSTDELDEVNTHTHICTLTD